MRRRGHRQGEPGEVLGGALCGAVGAGWLSAGELGASWVSVGGVTDRLELASRLAALLMPLGGALGALLVVLVPALRGLGAPPGPARWREPLPAVLLASPALLAIAWLLFTGPRAAALPARPLLVAAAGLGLHAAVYVAVRAALALLRRAGAMTRSRAAALFVGLLLLHIGVSHLGRVVLPGHYDYAHAALAGSAWAAASLALALLWLRSSASRALERRLDAPRALLALTALGAAMAMVALVARPSGHSVRAALHSPRAPATRALMRLITPLSPRRVGSGRPEDRERARRAWQERRARTVGGPVVPGAHIVLITIDALRADHLGAYGYAARPLSPSLDELAARSVVFEQAFGQAPHSSHSLASLMTSEYVPPRKELGLPLPTLTLARLLRDVGYHAAAFYTQGIFHTDGEHLARYRDARFDFERVSHRHLDAEARTDEVLHELGRIVELGEPPSFVWAHYFDAHEPYEATTFGDSEVQRYDGEILNVDRAVGRLLRGARERVSRPLVVVISADHGEEFRDHGGVYHGSTLYQEQIRVPLIVHVPGLSARRVPTPVELVDLAPTLLGLVGAPIPASMRGDDLRPLLQGAELDPGPAFASVGTSHMVVSWPYKLILDLRFGTVQLFDLARDPAERASLADERPDLAGRLQAELHAWLDSLSDTRDPHHAALQRGRMADRGAAPALAALLTDERADPSLRAEAARLLAVIPRANVLQSLRAAASSPRPEVATEARITLAWLGASGPRQPLYALLSDSDGDRRVRAAIGLGRVGDRAAVPVLVEAATHDSLALRHRMEAVRLLGVLEDPRGVEGLLGALREQRLRRRALLSLGWLAEPHTFPVLLDALHDTRSSAVREIAARALGHFGERRAIEPLTAAALREALPVAAESLVRLGAVGQSVGGIDLGPGVADVPGVRGCRSWIRPREEEYVGRSYCEVEETVALPLTLPAAVERAPSALALLHARRLDSGVPVGLRLRIGETPLDRVHVDGTWSEHRVVIERSALAASLTLDLEDPEARVALDHVLLLPMVP